MRTAALTTVIAAAALAACACTSTQTGQAAPTSGPAAASSASSSPSSGAKNGLTGLNACTLLTDAEAMQAAPAVGAHRDRGDFAGPGTSTCEWDAPVKNGTGGVSFGITVRPSQGLKDVVAEDTAIRSETTSDAGRQVLLLKNNGAGFSCFAAIAIGSGRVDINATTLRGGTTEDMCAIMNKVDNFAEPRLPAS